jgi:PAS domain S-box-containing protein
MDHTAERVLAETLQLRAQVLSLEQELRDCQRGREIERQTEANLRLFLDHVQDYAFISFSPDNRILSWSPGAERLFGYSEAEILGQSGSLIFTPEDRAVGADADELKTAQDHGSAEDERWHIRQDGSRFWASGVLTAHRDGDQLQGFSKVLRDLTARKLADDRIRASEEQFRLFSENVRDYALVPVDVHGLVSGWNTGAQRTFGYTHEEIIGQPVARFFSQEDAEKGESENDLSQALAEGRHEDERWMVRKDGSQFWARWVTTPMYDSNNQARGFAKVLRDETEKKNIEDRLKASLQEKEVLLREIHHRVKNNLTVISSLLSLEAGQVSDESVQQIFGELQDRVRAIASLHESIYRSPNLASIPFGSYIQHVLHDLVQFHNVDSKQISVHVESADIGLCIEQALPLGLVINELASNALKHAFAGRKEGAITVTVQWLPNCMGKDGKPRQNCCEMTVRDDGPGLANPDDFWHSTSMGLRIVRLLTDQLQGTLALGEGPGTCVSVRFPLMESGTEDTGSSRA